jgi:hypothetical protein
MEDHVFCVALDHLIRKFDIDFTECVRFSQAIVPDRAIFDRFWLIHPP